MKRNLIGAALAILSVSAVIEARAEEPCKDLLLHFVDESAAAGSSAKGSEIRKVTAIIPCESDGSSSHGAKPTTLHFMEHSDNKLCVSQRTCGNVKAWHGYFGVTVGWSDLTLLRDFWSLAKYSRINTDWNGNQVVATFAVGGGQIERDCEPMSPPSCVELSKGFKNDDLSWK
jgi:hypothetical protein